MSRGAAAILSLLAVIILAGGLGLIRPDGAGAWFDAAGRLAGIAGLACMLLAAVISVRLPGLDMWFGGLARLWQLHHRLGLASFVLVLSHPPLMALAAWSHGPAALGEVLLPPPGARALWSGWLALLAMQVFLAPGFRLFGRPEYQRWKALHFLAGIALLGALAHALPLTRAYPGHWRWVIWGVPGGLALLVFVWRATLARPLLRREYRITARQAPADRVVELSLQPQKGEALDFRPGQFVYLTPLDPGLRSGRGEEHPYTLSSAPGERQLRIAVKDLGDASGALQTVAVPSRARVEGPYGDFLPARRRMEPQLWIGGGIGVTPFVSAARAMARGMEHGPVTLFYCANDPSRAYFLDELREIARGRDDFHVIAHYYRDQGPLTQRFLLDQCADASGRHWAVCGPPPLVGLATRMARRLGVPRVNIHSETFQFS